MKTFITAILTAAVSASEANPPVWDTTSVKFIDPAAGDCQSIVDAVWFDVGGTTSCNHG